MSEHTPWFIGGQKQGTDSDESSALTTRVFEALSYRWEDPKSTSCLAIGNDAHLTIAASLEAFLRCRREQDKGIHLWIDAICINQNDNAERNAQV
jgi:hypothetical protein